MNPFCESFEHYSSTAQIADKWDATQGVALTTIDGRPWVQLGFVSGGAPDFLGKAVAPATPNRIMVGFAAWFDLNTAEDILLLRDASSNMLALNYDAGSFKLRLRRGGTVIFESDVVIPHHTRAYIEMRAVLDGVAGSVDLQVNGAPAGTFEGNTINSGTELDNIRIQCPGNTNTTAAGWYVRDIVIRDYGDFWGDTVVRTLRPNGAGVDDDWTASAEGDNYEMVNQEGPDDNTYVSTNVHGARDLYEFEDPAASTDSRVHFVQTVVRARKVDAGAGVLTMIARSGSDEDESEAHGLSEQFRYHVDSFTVNPATGQPWTIDELAAAQFGFKLETS